MRLIERYLFRQLLGPTLLATLALVALALLARSLSEFDVLIEQRQSATGLPEDHRPGPAPAAEHDSADRPVRGHPGGAEPAAHRAGDRGLFRGRHEPLAGDLAGHAPGRVRDPAVAGHEPVGAPWSSRAIRETFFDIKSDLASTLVRPGEFTEPGPGLTVYAQTIDRDQIIHNLFIHQESPTAAPSPTPPAKASSPSARACRC
jgi:lipopolysaccharide export system permease protein